jgi:hypothetical protein
MSMLSIGAAYLCVLTVHSNLLVHMYKYIVLKVSVACGVKSVLHCMCSINTCRSISFPTQLHVSYGTNSRSKSGKPVNWHLVSYVLPCGPWTISFIMVTHISRRKSRTQYQSYNWPGHADVPNIKYHFIGQVVLLL